MLEIIGMLIGMAIRLGLIGIEKKITSYVLFGLIMSLIIVSAVISFIGGTSTIVATSGSALTIIFYLIIGMLIASIGLMFARLAKKYNPLN